jgi:hypothetical protein
MADQNSGKSNFYKPKRSWVINACSFGPALYYFNKHRAVLLASKFQRKSASYYSPTKTALLGQGQQNFGHHIKEILARYCLGLVVGFVLAEVLFAK